MSYKDILVYLDAGPYLEPRLNAAVALARQHQARLIGVDISTDAAFTGEWQPRAESIEGMFETQARQAGLEFAYRSVNRKAASTNELFAHYVDLFIATQPHPDSAHLALSNVPEKILLNAGVPALIIPSWWNPQPIGKSVLIAWNASREATRAVHDAMPILKKAEKVVIFAFEPPYRTKNSDLEALVEHLGRHGVAARANAWPDTGVADVVPALFACLDYEDSDLIVAGAYGHSRWLEGLFGGASRDLLQQESMPVFMSH